MLAFIASIGISAQSFAITPETLPQHRQTMLYELYAGGIHAVEARIDLDIKSEERYSLQLDAKTRGFLGKLAPWNGTFETHGWRMNDEKSDMPELHRSTTTWRDETEVKSYNYKKDGSFESLNITEEGVDKSPESLDDELVQGTTDALTAAFEVMKLVGRGESCEGSSEVFDGKRRYKMVFREQAREMLSSSKYNAFEGEAIRCEVEVVPVAGAWHKKPRGWTSIQEQGREKGSLPTIWLAQVDDKGPAVPVKLRVKTDYGTLFMHMTGYKNGDRELKVSN